MTFLVSLAARLAHWLDTAFALPFGLHSPNGVGTTPLCDTTNLDQLDLQTVRRIICIFLFLTP